MNGVPTFLKLEQKANKVIQKKQKKGVHNISLAQIIVFYYRKKSKTKNEPTKRKKRGEEENNKSARKEKAEKIRNE